ncbi:MAG TPA: hypothetical protein VGS22_24855 [Thermoanaerobaculia bacterium]|nr:hypothetical protein [Thermoanaerobaculia bacterium]
METLTLANLKTQYLKDGFEQRVLVSDAQMAQLLDALNAEPGVIATPPDELRYIEGLAELPFGYLSDFKVIPAPGYEKCACGRRPSALEIVHSALRRRIHDKGLIRDTLLGFQNIFEIAQNGRQGECIACGRAVVMAVYGRISYMYA